MNNQLILFTSNDSKISLDVVLENENVWLTQKQIANLFEKELSVVTKHIRNVFTDNELDEKSNVQNLHIAKSDKPVAFYSLDVIISVGYRVKSNRGVEFRRLVNSVLKEC